MKGVVERMVEAVSKIMFVGVEMPKACEKQGFKKRLTVSYIHTICENGACESEDVQKGGRVSFWTEQSAPTVQKPG